MRTRSAAPSTAPAPEQAEQAEHAEPTPPIPSSQPCKTFILPSSAGDDARFLQLPNPRTSELTRYFFCPTLGVHEFTVISSPHSPRSILFARKSNQTPQGRISKSADLAIATPMDMMFFMVPLLSPSSSSQTKGLFQPLDDIIDSQDELPPHFRYVLYNESFRQILQDRAEAISDVVEAGDEKMFRFSESKLLQELIAKAERMVAQGLPPSLEERFVRQALATPLMAVKREDLNTNSTGVPSNDNEEGETESPEKKDSSTPTASSASVSTPSGESASTPATEQLPEQQGPPDGIAHLLRISTALSFIKESYLPKSTSTRLDEMLAAPETPVDFKPLQEHLKRIAELRAEALASRSLGDFSRKRGADDDEAAEARAEKKQRKEEEEKKKKASESRGVKDLKKVNTTGMKKMSDFFGKAAAKKKS